MTLPCVYLLPGLMCDAAVWSHQRAALAPHADVRIPDFRGFSSLRAMAEHVLAGAPQRFSVAGHSMDGRVAFELMEIAGKRMERFAVMDTGVHGRGAACCARGLAAVRRRGQLESCQPARGDA